MNEPKDERILKPDPECEKRWPECHEGTYDPRCCRFPKSCSPFIWVLPEEAEKV